MAGRGELEFNSNFKSHKIFYSFPKVLGFNSPLFSIFGRRYIYYIGKRSRSLRSLLNMSFSPFWTEKQPTIVHFMVFSPMLKTYDRALFCNPVTETGLHEFLLSVSETVLHELGWVTLANIKYFARKIMFMVSFISSFFNG